MVENLLYVNYCPKKSVEEVMNPEFIKNVSRDSVFNLKTNHIFIDYCLELDHPEYNGPRLSEELKSFLIEVRINLLDLIIKKLTVIKLFRDMVQSKRKLFTGLKGNML